MQEDFWERNAKEWNQVIQDGIFKSRTITSPAIISEIKHYKFKSVLDVGCGEGWIAGVLTPEQIDYIGIDGSAALVHIARAKHSARFEKVTYQELSSQIWNPGKRFDGIIFNFSLLEESVSDLLLATKKLLNPCGKLIVQTLHPFFTLPEYKNGWNKEDFKSSGVMFSGEMQWYGRDQPGVLLPLTLLTIRSQAS